MTRLILVFFLLMMVVACGQVTPFMDFTGLNGRHILEYQPRDTTNVRCVAPPSNLIANGKNGGITPDVFLRKLGEFITSTETINPQPLKEISADFPDTEVLHFRLCEQYGNRTLTLEQYQQLQKILQVIQEASHAPPRLGAPS